MENKKLVKILLKDMSELEELISDVKSKGNFDSLEMEFIHTRAKGLVQLLQLLDNNDFAIKAETSLAKTSEEIQNSKVEQKQSDTKEFSTEVEEKYQGIGKETADNKMDAGTADNEISEGHEENEVQSEDDNEMLVGESDKPEKGSRLGDSFLKGKSINDLITDQHKLEFKLSNRPVKSIRAAIGINDRFQYIRELFDGDTQKFNNSIEILDSMGNIKEAVDYLRQNFKWKKTETSLKFVNLVKRRFHNSEESQS